jgi:hypothetical protein
VPLRSTYPASPISLALILASTIVWLEIDSGVNVCRLRHWRGL